eukprot:scaffold87426_cov75-Phaeocystis_antarctica.AAC.1
MSRPKSASVIEAAITAVTPTPTWSAWEVHGALGLRPGQPGLQPGLKRGADAHRARCHINEAEAGGVRLDGEVSEADGGEGVEGKVEGVEVRPVVVVQPEGHRVAGLVSIAEARA